jgi:Leucine-rich repeat (LRR) protein
VPPGPLYNFDITAVDWAGALGVTDQASFEAFILGSSNYTNITVNSFNYTPTRIQANINVTGGSSLNFGSVGNGFEIIHALSGFDNLSSLSLDNNLLTDFNPTIPLDSTLGSLYLNNNLIVNFNPTIPLPTNLGLLNLNNNLIANFNPTIALPSSLLVLELKNNQIVTFNPTNPLPSPIFLLNLDNNLLTDFNPTTLFPTTSLMDLRLKNNLITTAGYVASEPWANSLSAGMSAIQFAGNVDSVAGTNLESILTGKGYNVIP